MFSEDLAEEEVRQAQEKFESVVKDFIREQHVLETTIDCEEYDIIVERYVPMIDNIQKLLTQKWVSISQMATRDCDLYKYRNIRDEMAKTTASLQTDVEKLKKIRRRFIPWALTTCIFVWIMDLYEQQVLKKTQPQTNNKDNDNVAEHPQKKKTEDCVNQHNKIRPRESSNATSSEDGKGGKKETIISGKYANYSRS